GNIIGEDGYIAAWYEKSAHSKLLKQYPNYRILAISNDIRRQIEDKTKLHEYLSEAGCNSKDKLLTKIYDLKKLPEFPVLVDLCEGVFVLQGISKGADGTFIIRNEIDYL